MQLRGEPIEHLRNKYVFLNENTNSKPIDSVITPKINNKGEKKAEPVVKRQRNYNIVSHQRMLALWEKLRKGTTFFRGIYRFNQVIRQRDEDRFNFLDDFYHNEIPKVMESAIQTVMDSLSPILTKLIET